MTKWEQYGKTVGEPDPKRAKGFKAIAHTYSYAMAKHIVELHNRAVELEQAAATLKRTQRAA